MESLGLSQKVIGNLFAIRHCTVGPELLKSDIVCRSYDNVYRGLLFFLDTECVYGMVSESRVTWATSVPILVFLGLSVLDLGPMYATDVRRQIDVRRQTDVSQTDIRQHHAYAPAWGGA